MKWIVLFCASFSFLRWSIASHPPKSFPEEAEVSVTTEGTSTGSFGSKGYQSLWKHLAFYGISNQRDKFFLPYGNITFGVLQYEKVLLDSGSNSLSLSLTAVEDLDTLFKAYPSASFNYYLTPANSVTASRYYMLNIHSVTEEPSFPFMLEGKVVLVLKTLRFQLCQDDINHLRTHHMNKFTKSQQKQLLNITQFPSERLKNVNVMGQDIFKQFFCVQLKRVTMCFDKMALNDETTIKWKHFDELNTDILTHHYDNLPVGFSDWSIALTPEFDEVDPDSGGRPCNGVCRETTIVLAGLNSGSFLC